MSLVDTQSGFLLDVCKLIYFATERGWRVVGGELLRTPQQHAFYLQSGKCRNTDSPHLRKLAIDLNFVSHTGVTCYRADELQPVGDFWESLNPKNFWGGNSPEHRDTPHFERHE